MTLSGEGVLCRLVRADVLASVSLSDIRDVLEDGAHCFDSFLAWPLAVPCGSGPSALKESTNTQPGFLPPEILLGVLGFSERSGDGDRREGSPQALAFGLLPHLPVPCCTRHGDPSRWYEGALTLIWKLSPPPEPIDADAVCSARLPFPQRDPPAGSSR